MREKAMMVIVVMTVIEMMVMRVMVMVMIMMVWFWLVSGDGAGDDAVTSVTSVTTGQRQHC